VQSPRLLALLIAITFVAITPISAFAHERRTVDKYSFVVGFNEEPALQGQPNAAQLTVTVPTESNRPVDGLADTLKCTVAFGGGQPKEFKLRSVFGTPGRYVADFVPTRAGTYIFNFSGTVEGANVNEHFESGPGRFNDVEAIDTMQFPDQIPPANEAVRQAQNAAQRADEAESALSSAQARANLGLGFGLFGVLLAIGALIMGARRA
jgi:hypothetical protein